MNNLANQVVFITGAGRGMGRYIAEGMSACGCIVAANDITPINVDKVVNGIVSRGGSAKSYLADVSKKMPVQAMINEIIDDWGEIDILVNYANVNPKTPLLEMDEWDWRRTIDVNLTGAFLVTQSVGRVMKKQERGYIFYVIHVSGKMLSFAHSATVQALTALSHAVHDEFQAYNTQCKVIFLGPEKSQEDILNEIISTFNT